MLVMVETYSNVEHVIDDLFWLIYITIRDLTINDSMVMVMDLMVRYRESRKNRTSVRNDRDKEENESYLKKISSR